MTTRAASYQFSTYAGINPIFNVTHFSAGPNQSFMGDAAKWDLASYMFAPTGVTASLTPATPQNGLPEQS